MVIAMVIRLSSISCCRGELHLLGVNQGANELLWLRPYLSRELHIGYKEIPFEVLSIENAEAQIGVSTRTMRYRLSSWLPLNQKNDKLFHSTKDEGERLLLLEGILDAVRFVAALSGAAPSRR